MKNYLKQILVYSFLIIIPHTIFGQDPGTDPDVPIDGGLGFLLAAGAGYVAHGLNRKRKRRKNEQDEETDSAGK
ncbi:MAG: hypothetical protein RL037_2165 [Bacteroidota bacterium]|jgi:hypothetical protein